MKSIATFSSVLALSLLLTACGGIEQTTLSAGPLMYGQLAQFTVEGPNLDKGMTLTAAGCIGIAEVTASATASTKVYTCTPTATGAMVVTASGGGVTLRSMTVDIPVPQVSLKTSMGDIVLELDPGKAPISAFNFIRYVNSGFYTDIIFHRVLPNVIIQAGGFTTGPAAKAPTYAAIALESNNGLTNLRGTLAMARSAADASGTSQFYINVADNPGFDYVSATQPGYAVFGKVATGLSVVDTIGAVPTGTVGTMNDVPLTDVLILSATQTR